MKFLTDKNKRHFKILQCGCFPCKACKLNNKVNGNYIVLQDKGTESVDGSRAYRIFFTCNYSSHFSFVGYTKPVNFQKIHGANENKDIVRYDEEEDENAAEWKDIFEHKKVY